MPYFKSARVFLEITGTFVFPALPGYSYISTPSIGIPAAAAAVADVAAAANSQTGYYTEYCPTATTAIPAGTCQQQVASGHHHLAPTALGIVGLPRTEANALSGVGATSPVHHREQQYLIQRQSNGPVTLQTVTSQNQGLLSLQDYSS